MSGGAGLFGDTPGLLPGYFSLVNSGVIWPPGAVRTNAGTAMTKNRAYFIYIGRASAVEIIKYVAVPQTSNATTDFAGEVGVFTTPKPPIRATGQTLTKVWASALPDMTSGSGALRVNVTANAISHPVDAPTWIAWRANNTGTMPSVAQIIRNFAAGDVLVTDTAGALTASTTFVGAIPAFSDIAPLLIACKD